MAKSTPKQTKDDLDGIAAAIGGAITQLERKARIHLPIAYEIETVVEAHLRPILARIEQLRGRL